MSEPQNESAASYSSPVSDLLTYGAIKNWIEWPNYLELGLTSEHVPELIRMALDKRLNWALTDEKSTEIWAPIHAVRALGQLRAEEAIEPLLALFHEFEEDGGSDWVDSELTRAYALIGTASLPALIGYFRDETRGMYPRTEAMIGLQKIAETYPESRQEVVATLSQQLEAYATNDPTFNAFIVDTLLDLKAVEALPVIEQAYAADQVDWSITGDWDDVQVEFGLKEPDPNKKRPPLFPFLNFGSNLVDSADTETPEVFPRLSHFSSPTKAGKKQKVKRKQADKTRKMNRKRNKR